MNKTELLQKLSTKFYKVGTPHPQYMTGDPPVPTPDENGLQYYLVKVHDLVNDGLRDINIAFYEDTVTGDAFWAPSEPKPDPVSGFQQEVAIYIESKITDNTIEAAFPEQIDTVNEAAIFKVVMPDLSEKRLFVDKDAGVLRHRPMV